MRLNGYWAPLLIVAAAAPTHAAGHVWKSYIVSRYAIAACYPVDLLTPQPMPGNGDGRTFKGRNAEMLVWGQHDLDASLADDAAATVEALKADNGRILRRRIGKRDYVIEARKGGRLIYQRTLHARGDFKSLSISYPAAQVGFWRSVVAHANSCFGSLGASTN